MPYSSKYVEITNIPVQIPDDYTNREKEDALEFAESALELDINSGKELDLSGLPLSIQTAIRTAVKQKATCELVKGAEDPTSVKLGDLSDDGTNKADYAESFCDRYDELVEKIEETDQTDDADRRYVKPYVYNTKGSKNNCYR